MKLSTSLCFTIEGFDMNEGEFRSYKKASQA